MSSLCLWPPPTSAASIALFPQRKKFGYITSISESVLSDMKILRRLCCKQSFLIYKVSKHFAESNHCFQSYLIPKDVHLSK